MLNFNNDGDGGVRRNTKNLTDNRSFEFEIFSHSMNMQLFLRRKRMKVNFDIREKKKEPQGLEIGIDK
jgi:hypothetical protein